MTVPLRVVQVAVALALTVLVASACTTEVGSLPAAELPGRQAIEAAQGEPHVLWFWGAN